MNPSLRFCLRQFLPYFTCTWLNIKLNVTTDKAPTRVDCLQIKLASCILHLAFSIYHFFIFYFAFCMSMSIIISICISISSYICILHLHLYLHQVHRKMDQNPSMHNVVQTQPTTFARGSPLCSIYLTLGHNLVH